MTVLTPEQNTQLTKELAAHERKLATYTRAAEVLASIVEAMEEEFADDDATDELLAGAFDEIRAIASHIEHVLGNETYDD